MEALFNLPLPLIIFIIIAVAATLALILFVYLKDRSLENIRTDVYKLMCVAEQKYKESKAGQQKMKWVISKARLLLPRWLQELLSDEALEKILQIYFDQIKDIMDNGHIDGSAK